MGSSRVLPQASGRDMTAAEGAAAAFLEALGIDDELILVRNCAAVLGVRASPAAVRRYRAHRLSAR